MGKDDDLKSVSKDVEDLLDSLDPVGEFLDTTEVKATAQEIKFRIHLQQAIEAQKKVNQLDADLKDAKAELRELVQDKIPEFMDQHRVLMTDMGPWQITVRDRFEGNLPKDPAKRSAAISYLEELGAGELVQCDVRVSFTREELELARMCRDALISEGYTPLSEETVHHSTLKAFVRQALEDGKDITPQKLGVHHMREASFKLKD